MELLDRGLASENGEPEKLFHDLRRMGCGILVRPAFRKTLPAMAITSHRGPMRALLAHEAIRHRFN
jgi:hypothetical protein